MKGHLHPITLLTEKVVQYFEPYGFEVVTGPELENEDYNFEKLRMFVDHPARDEHDTFYINPTTVLRTHTSNMQLRAMETRQAPVRLLSPGRAYRNEAVDATHHYVFHQIEGLVIDKDITMRELIGSLQGLMRYLVGNDVEFRIRPGYFPFVEPGIELDFRRPNGSWIELLGAGMVHPEVLGNMGVDPKKFTGFAFGVGVERLLSVVCGQNDVRLSLENDYRYLGQFK